MKFNLFEVAGWYGVVAILSAYLLNNFGFLEVSHILYLFLNLTGGLGIVIDAWKQKNYQPVVLNIIWSLVALFGILRVFVN